MTTKKGISPLIATVLIIGFVIVLAALVMQWGGGLFESIKEETSVSSEVSLICSTKLTELKVTKAELDGVKEEDANGNVETCPAGATCPTGTCVSEICYTTEPTNVVVTIDNSNEQEITGFLFRGHLAAGTVVTATKDATDDVLESFGVKPYTLSIDTDGDLEGLMKDDKVGVMAIITAEDGSKHPCINEKKVTVAA